MNQPYSGDDFSGTSARTSIVDPHKQSHTAVAAGELGRKKAQRTVRARREGHRALIARARELAPAGRLRAVEDVRHVAGG
jgi:hypothetical protein